MHGIRAAFSLEGEAGVEAIVGAAKLGARAGAGRARRGQGRGGKRALGSVARAGGQRQQEWVSDAQLSHRRRAHTS
jgi:hypothetical protein